MSKISPATNGVGATVGVGSLPLGVAYDGDHIWVTNSGADTVSKISPIDNIVVDAIPLASGPIGVAFDGAHVWVTRAGAGSVSKINPSTNAVTGTVDGLPRGSRGRCT